MKTVNIKPKCQNCKEFMDRLLKEQVESLKEENKVLEQALKMAVYENVDCCLCPLSGTRNCPNIEEGGHDCNDSIINYFKTKAKEMMKSE